MQGNYQAFIDRVIKKYEGGYGWDKGDPGGPTNFGITCYDLAEHRHQKMTSMAAWAVPVKSMTLAEAEAIYQDKYAAGLGFSILPSGADCCILDYGINSGLPRPIAAAHAIVRLPNSGKVDSALVDAIEKYGVSKFTKMLDNERLSFMHAIQGGRMWQRFGHGWQSRVNDLDNYCAALARNDTPVEAVDLSHVVTPKAIHVAKTAGGITAGGAVAVPAGLHVGGFSHWAVGAVAAGVVIAGVAYEAYQSKATAAANLKVVLPAGA